MLGRRQEINLQLTEALDSVILAVSLWISFFLRASVLHHFFPSLEKIQIPPIQDFLWVAVVIVLFTPIMLESRGFYTHVTSKSVIRSLRQMAGALVGVGTIIGAFVIFFRWEVPSRFTMVIDIFVSAGMLLLRESIQRNNLRRTLANGTSRENVLIAGMPADVDHLLRGMTDEQRAELSVKGVIDITTEPVSALVAAMHEQSVSRVIFAAQHVHFVKIEEAVQACETEGVEAWISADFFQTSIARPTFDVLSGKLMLVFHSTPQISWALVVKDMLDRVGSVVFLILSLPLWVIAAIGIRLSSKGPIFFRQERSGRYGRPFMMWKFRTMHADAEEQRSELEVHNEMDGPVFKIRNDPRIFPFGQFLRKFSIDEFPQLINVVRGEMSLVGPRPLPVYEINRIEKHAQRRRLSVKPGLTCLWQVSGRNGIKNFEEWVALDLKYIDNWSLLLDLQILCLTVPAVIRGSGAH